MSSHQLDVGSTVRFEQEPGQKMRAVVACVEKVGGETLYDLVLSDPATHGGDALQEVSQVEQSRLQALEDFETDGSMSALADPGPKPTAEQRGERGTKLKDYGNVLFKMQDYHAAADVYRLALRCVEPAATTGASLLVRQQDGRCRAAMVSGVGTTGHVDVIYDEEDEDEGDEEDGVDASRITAVSELPQLQSALHLNLARCYGKLGLQQKVVDTCTTVAALAKHVLSDQSASKQSQLRQELRAQCFTAFYLRSRAHLAQNHIPQAARDVRYMAALDPSNKAIKQVQQELDRASQRLLRENKQLVKNVSHWVEQSMSKHNELETGGTASSAKHGLEDGVEETKGGPHAGPGAQGQKGQGWLSWFGR